MTFLRHSLFVGAALSIWISPGLAVDTYNTNCTLPPANATHTFYYVSAPNVRGSLQILWSCLLTLTICVYQVLHLPLPEQRNGRDPGWWGDIKWMGVWRDLVYALVVVLAPELVLTASIADLCVARNGLRDLHQAVPGARTTWSLTHMFYANMGGLVTPSKDEMLVLRPKDILIAIESKALSEHAPMTTEEIMDKSKSDTFAKALSIMQILYFYIEFFARVAQRLPISLLELGVAGVALFSLISYACLWHKPKAVQTPTIVQSNGHPQNSADVIHIRHMIRNLDYRGVEAFLYDVNKSGWGLGAVYLGATAHGAIHLAAWNFEFPSTADMWIWRAASLFVTVTGLLLLLLVETPQRFYINILIWVWSCFYIVARLMLVVEMIRCMFFLPPAAFQTTSWTMSIPHLG